MLDLDLAREGAAPRDAATVILLRDAHDSSGAPVVEVFCVERNKKSRFLGGAIVFPGGKVDPEDHAPSWVERSTSPRDPGSPGFGHGVALRALAVAALRESVEEAALLPVEGGRLTDAELLAMRADITAGRGSLASFLEARGLRLDAAALYPFARWITPVVENRRYDTRFFLAEAPHGQSGAHDARETMNSFWARPVDVLGRFVAGEIQLAPPTQRSLEILSRFARTVDALASAASACLDPICPRLVPHVDGAGSTMALVLPGDPEHEIRDARVPGRSRFVLRGERWLPEDAPSR